MVTSGIIVVLIGVVTGKLNWSVCNVRNSFHVSPVSMKECMRSCQMVSACTWITYISRGPICHLHDKFEERDACPGSVAVPKEEFDVDIDVDCTVRQCPPISICDQETKRCVAQAVCQPPPDVSSSIVQGNMRTEGSKVKYTCDDGRVFISTCQSTGQWAEVPACGQVAFSVGRITHLTVTDATNIPFSQTITKHNTENSVENGVFRCTAPGLYEFLVYSLTQRDKELFLELYRNSELVASVYGFTPGDFAAAANAAILDLHYGDLVQLKSRSQFTVGIFGRDNEIYTTFTGMRLGSPYNVESGETIASFSVTLTHDSEVLEGMAVHYDKVLVDTTNGYDKNTGVYTAPTGGIYMFHFFSLTTRNGELWQELYNNEHYVCSIYANSTDTFGSAGNTAILHLNAHAQVTIKANLGRVNDLFGRTDEIYSTFTGTKLITETEIADMADNIGHAFSVGLSRGYTVPDGGKLVFDRIFLDLSQTYSDVTGEFIAPVSGLYVFNYHIMGTKGSLAWFDLYHNNNYVNSVFGRTPFGYGSGGNAAVIDVDQNDVVYVKSRGANSVYGRTDDLYCTFSGYLLKPRDSAR